MPKRIDRPGRTQLALRVPYVEREKLAVQVLGLVTGLGRPSAFIHELALEHRKIHAFDNPERDLNGFVLLDAVLALSKRLDLGHRALLSV